MMGLGKPQGFAKFEVAGFIYYGNIREFVCKIWDKPKWGNPYYLEKLMLPLDSQTQCFLFDFYEKLHFTMENFKFRRL